VGVRGWERILRTEVRKTYKLFIGGTFPRSESGRSYVVERAGVAGWAVNAAQASRKDARDAVAAARKAVGGWSGATAYNRGQVLYRIAEMLEARRAEFDPSEVDAAIDRWVWYAGWSDKLSAVAGSANPVAGPYFNFSVPEPTGVVAVLAPPESPLLGLVSVLAPVIVSGNTAVVLAAEQAPVTAITLAEVLAVSDVPPGVVNVLTGRLVEVAPHLAAHMDVNALDLCGAPPDLADELTVAAAGNLKRVVRLPWDAPGTDRMLAYLETKTVWHPAGP
jgi:acyl-CoA reductase-like NAD-dependent aldehyde dehydrogenase